MQSLKIFTAAVLLYVFTCASAYALPQAVEATSVHRTETATAAADPDPSFTNELLTDMQRQLALTQEQVSRIRPLVIAHQTAENTYFRSLEDKLVSMLTPAQKTKLDTLRVRAQQDPNALKGLSLQTELGLTAVQMDQMRAFVTANQQLRAQNTEAFFSSLRDVLTAEQKAKLDMILATPTDNE